MDSPTKGLIDIRVGSDICFRETGYYLTAWYLTRPGYIKIPVGYLRLFRALDIYGGERLLYTDTEGLGRLDLFIIGFLKFVRTLDIGGSGIPDLFHVLCKLGTTEIREFLLGTIERDPGGWIYEEPNKTLEL